VIYDSDTTLVYVIYWWCHSFNRFYEIDCEFVDNSWDWASISDSIFDSGKASKIRLSILNKQLLNYWCLIVVLGYLTIQELYYYGCIIRSIVFIDIVVNLNNLWDWTSISESGEASKIPLFMLNKQSLKLFILINLFD